MSKMIKIKRGLDTNRANYLLELGELVWATDTHELWVGDGQTVGGFKVTELVEANYIPNSTRGSQNGVATLGFDGKIPSSQLPSLVISESYVVNNEVEQLALTAQEGDIAVRLDQNKTYIHNGGLNGDITDWTELLSSGEVLSVNGKIGQVVLSLDDLSDVSVSGNIPTGNILQFDGTSWTYVDTNTIGRTAFIELDDTPASYTGKDGELLIVSGNSVAFTDTVDGGSFGS